ncbi:MAG: N-formylglutamate amidohydrolase [Thermodesulfobacteriota bacterium]|nr:N-formylglutamate amidohydrolase [Thermodesulfobacteriota bacterium]
MTENLPVLVSIPHGGLQIPKELKDRICLNEINIFDDSDPFTQEIYNLGDRASFVIISYIARAFVDLNRSTDDLPPKNPDGVIKSHTCNRQIIYKKGLEPDILLIKKLLEKYYEPYHRKIREVLAENNHNIELALDCHSMAAYGPEISPDPGKRRPIICLGNQNNKTSSRKMINKLTDCFRQAFDLDAGEVTENKPFTGGYITQMYGGNPIPWIQVEMNRDLYLKSAYFDRNTLKVHGDRLQELNLRFKKTLFLFCD